MKCYICGFEEFVVRKGKVRDNPDLRILECRNCGLVVLDSFSHIDESFYESSQMHSWSSAEVGELYKSRESKAEDRFQMLKGVLPNKRILDFGCGTGGFLLKAQKVAKTVVGVELDRRDRSWLAEKIPCYRELAELEDKFDLITAFHVLEHLLDPRKILSEMKSVLADGGQLVVEVPNAEDALITLYDCLPFQHFTYWSAHLFLFNAHNLRMLAEQAGYQVVAIRQFQRYPLSNHLYWLSRGKPGGHQHWSFLDSDSVINGYAKALADIGKCDTLIAYLCPAPSRPPVVI